MSREEKLKTIIFSIVKRLPHNITRTKLVKLLYLIDLYYARVKSRSLTGLTYRSYYFGPYSGEIINAINQLKGYEIEEYSNTSLDGREYYLYRPGMNPRWEVPPALEYEEERVIDQVVSEHGNKSLDEILRYVYNTEPYKNCKKGRPIVLNPHA
ncbi:MAG: SocA family protein [Deltaproteobacteria bacterium]|nr:MAG: SocA family protein [Deltaproteobacteria bacterium]